VRILVVDDDEAVRTGLRSVLDSEGYDVCMAANGLEAEQELRNTGADLVLVDMNMPVRNGWGTIARLRGIKPHVPIMIITARPDQRRAAHAAGLELMEKPLEIPILIERIAALLHVAESQAGISAA
jgi:DNA-binding response OmpR family regulator